MKTLIIKILFASSLLVGLIACGNPDDHSHNLDENSENKPAEELVQLNSDQFNALKMIVDTVPIQNISNYVETNGQLEVPPQNEANVTAIIGANISSIEIIEGNKVEKGEILAYISHPDIIQLQIEYNKSWNELQFARQELNRQQRLYDEKVGSGKILQQANSDFNTLVSNTNGLAAKLHLLGISTSLVEQGKIIDKVAVKSPIEGYIRLVDVKTGQYVSPQKVMFEIVNLEHIHADFMVFEKDIAKIHQGQKIQFQVESIKHTLEASVYSVGKSFEQDPKAIHIHAEIEDKNGLLLPGMYVRGRILTGDTLGYALPENAIVHDNGKDFVFEARQVNDSLWNFKAVEVILGETFNGRTAIHFLSKIPKNYKVAWNNAYYINAERLKEEVEHGH